MFYFRGTRPLCRGPPCRDHLVATTLSQATLSQAHLVAGHFVAGFFCFLFLGRPKLCSPCAVLNPTATTMGILKS
ncbi:unnamed protein product [Meloidogyne enterolobii]|uniref:Uncharacterized protein n=1 Tax=Meloidogyne enterolobii TaxID=390850 RepID=A0ACB0ZH11_MELEN